MKICLLLQHLNCYFLQIAVLFFSIEVIILPAFGMQTISWWLFQVVMIQPLHCVTWEIVILLNTIIVWNAFWWWKDSIKYVLKLGPTLFLCTIGNLLTKTGLLRTREGNRGDSCKVGISVMIGQFCYKYCTTYYSNLPIQVANFWHLDIHTFYIR